MVSRLLTAESKIGAIYDRLTAVEVAVHELRGEVGGLRADLNRGVGMLVAGLESLEKTINRVAEIRPRLDALERRVDRLEGHA